MRRFAGQYKKQSIYGLGAQVSISAPSRPYFVTAGYLSQLTHGRLADLPRARTAGCPRTAGWRPFHHEEQEEEEEEEPNYFDSSGDEIPYVKRSRRR